MSNQIKLPIYHLKTAFSSRPLIFPICSTLSPIRENAVNDRATAPCKSPGRANCKMQGCASFCKHKTSKIQLRKKCTQPYVFKLCSADANDVRHNFQHFEGLKMNFSCDFPALFNTFNGTLRGSICLRCHKDTAALHAIQGSLP